MLPLTPHPLKLAGHRGFEPLISALTTQRPLQTGPISRRDYTVVKSTRLPLKVEKLAEEAGFEPAHR